MRHDLLPHDPDFLKWLPNFERFKQDLPAALALVTRARRRELDRLLIIQPGKNRGSAI